jgi:SAM-dependent methyltransferase
MKKCWCGNEDLNEYSEDYYKCDKCHTLISKNDFSDDIYYIQDEKNDLYGKNYWETTMTKAAGKSTLSEVVDMYLTERVLYWLKYILKYTKFDSNVAEVGCGLGQLQYILKKLGYNQLAFEVSPYICDYMEKNLGICTYCGPFTERENEFDVILAFDLFEHLNEPLEFIEKCSKSLKAGGVVCFQTPCYNPKLSYDEMLETAGKFEPQLKAEQHIFIYSKDAMVKILKQYGFKYIIFEPAFFGDDFDMFFFASKSELVVNKNEEIDDFLNSQENGRLVKALLTLFEQNQNLYKDFLIADDDRNKRLEQINTLSQKLEESENDRVARLEQINTMSQMLKESENDRAARLEQINTMSQMLKESENDRAARLEQINILTKELQK